MFVFFFCFVLGELTICNILAICWNPVINYTVKVLNCQQDCPNIIFFHKPIPISLVHKSTSISRPPLNLQLVPPCYPFLLWNLTGDIILYMTVFSHLRGILLINKYHCGRMQFITNRTVYHAFLMSDWSVLYSNISHKA